MIANVPEAPSIDGVRPVYSGKVRDLYEYPDGRILFVASDRISAYDWVLPTTIPDKGRVLTAMSVWWFEQLGDLVANHLLSTDVPQQVAGRAMVTQQLDMLPVECVARGYLTGSGLTDYLATGSVCGNDLPSGLVDGSRLPAAIFTPATKAALGEHDENVDFDGVVATVGPVDAEALRSLTLHLYGHAEKMARDRGIIVADTKFEFGRHPTTGVITLADEVLTPDSSRFWPADEWEPGHRQPPFDKQFVRDWLTSPAAKWDRSSGEPPPPLPEEVVALTRAKYIEAYERLTAKTWS